MTYRALLLTDSEHAQLLTNAQMMSVPTVQEIMEAHHLFDSVAWWELKRGRVSVCKKDLRKALEGAYDPLMPDWVATVNLEG